ncbi:PREDICTED: altered inheritance of mitochondria protein 32-like [Lupinus angustifolius]|uniref:altered inheritance of mitochondria protein 32-like n=1 Tax=Lupinus angustifolius TaxID=3871 RepID=UPI00092E91F9|nr:PREDICTED: altered inheritance of mitochondria protein 32-like [Lupinus angustifolius]
MDREESLSFTVPSSSSSSSASGSFHNDGLLIGDSSDSDFGFSRLDFRQSSLPGTVEFYNRHVFLCYKNPRFWPPRIQAADFDRLPRLLYAALLTNNTLINKETRLTICEGHDGTETSNGDVLIFPDMIRYRRLTHFDVETFVEEVLVKDGEWLPGTPETLHGSYVFVCSHGSRDRRCGVCGPVLVSRFKEEIELRSLQGKVFVSPCSHIGGHEYAGNVIIFGSSMNGEVTGHWYGYVAPDDVPLLIQQHILKGEIIDSLWRGQMGLSEYEQMKEQEQRLLLNGIRSSEESSAAYRSQDNFVSFCQSNGVGYCQENGDSACSQNTVLVEKRKNPDAIEVEAKLIADSNSTETAISKIKSGKETSRKVHSMTWLDGWEQEDTYAALAVACAAVSVVVAYKFYKVL